MLLVAGLILGASDSWYVLQGLFELFTDIGRREALETVSRGACAMFWSKYLMCLCDLKYHGAKSAKSACKT